VGFDYVGDERSESRGTESHPIRRDRAKRVVRRTG
jgi:hypothetical protein